MHVGMLWFDSAPNAGLKTKIQNAVIYYRNKYHQEPNLCLIHPSMMDKDGLEIDDMTIRSYRPVLPGHLWIGIEDRD